MSLDTTKILKKVKYNGVDFALNSEWQPDADMQWARSVFENDVQEGYTYKVLVLMSGYDDTTEIPIYNRISGYIDSSFVKTSDGVIYTYQNGQRKIKHVWDDTHAKQSMIGDYKLRWVIYYFDAPEKIYSSGAFPSVAKYICHNCKVYLSSSNYYSLEYIEALGDGDNIVIYNFMDCRALRGMNKLTIPDGFDTASLFSGCYNLSSLPKEIKGKFTSLSYTFNNNCNLKKFPIMDTKDVQNFTSAFSGVTLVEFSGIDFRSGTIFTNTFNLGSQLRKMTGVDFRSATTIGTIFQFSYILTVLEIKNINAALQIGSGTSYGHLLTLDSLLNTIKELWDNTEGETTKTLTVGSANLTKLANIYVKLIDITDEMRAEDEFIDLKLPFVVCESTDEGAMLITDYVQSKNWTLA